MITVSHLTKRYGDVLAVDDLSFEIDEGHVYGFLGPNGAGKSTTMNIMTGCLSATAGTVEIDGCDIFEQPNEAKRRIGYLPEQPPLYLSESPYEYLQFVGEAKGLRGTALAQQISSVIEQTGIGEVRHRRIAALSKGYRQRVGIAQALLGDPRVIILDEPTVGLDPLQIIEIRDLIRALGRERTVIFSSHILSEVQTICDQILIISKGRLVAFDKPEGLEKRLLAPGEIVLTVDGAAAQTEQVLQQAGFAKASVTAQDGCTAVHLHVNHNDMNHTARTLFFAFAAAHLAILEMRQDKASLEQVFLELTEGDTSVSAPDASQDGASAQTDETESGVEDA